MDDLERVGGDLDARARHVQHAAVTGPIEPFEERGLVREDAQLVAVDHVETEQVGVEEARWTGARHHRAGTDVLDVAHGTRELAVDLRIAEHALHVVGHLVDHRVPDGAGELQPVQVDRTV